MPDQEPVKGGLVSKTARDLAAEVGSQTKQRVADQVVLYVTAAGGVILSSLAAWLEAASDLQRGLLWGGGLVLLLEAAFLLITSVLALRRRRRGLWPVRKRKANPTAAEEAAHLQAVADQAAMLLKTADKISERTLKAIDDLRQECAKRGVELADIPEDIRLELLRELLNGPPAD